MTAKRSAVSRYLAEIGKRGGEKSSPAKAAAARLNGQKGGWPKGKKRKVKRNDG